MIGFGAIEGADIIGGQLDLPGAFARFVTIATLAGFPIAILLAWMYDLTSKGVVGTDESEATSVSTSIVVAVLVAAALGRAAALAGHMSHACPTPRRGLRNLVDSLRLARPAAGFRRSAGEPANY